MECQSGFQENLLLDVQTSIRLPKLAAAPYFSMCIIC